jgi:hypothetical protein
METAFAETAMMPVDETPTAALLPAVLSLRSHTPVIVPTATLIYHAVLAYFRAEQHLPALVALHPLRLLTIPSSQWGCYAIRDYGTIALRTMTLVECGQVGGNADVMKCEV